jgi:hypothetical protein
MRFLQCQKCGERFGCGVASGACWCSRLELDREALAELTSGGGDCLCPECLPLAAPASVAPPAGA